MIAGIINKHPEKKISDGDYSVRSTDTHRHPSVVYTLGRIQSAKTLLPEPYREEGKQAKRNWTAVPLIKAFNITWFGPELGRLTL